jgi:ABC-type antimicrobial peptide transport system permease subunit
MDEILSRSTARRFQHVIAHHVWSLGAAPGGDCIYGLMAYSVQQRGYEIGVRLALGADTRTVRNMIIFQGMRLAVVGLAIGIASSFGLTRLLAGFLFGVRARDALVFAAVPAVLCIVILFAVWIPSLQATRIDPMNALRTE